MEPLGSFQPLPSSARADARVDGDRVEVEVPGLQGRLRLVANPHTLERIASEGADPALQQGVLNVNGRDLGAALLKE